MRATPLVIGDVVGFDILARSSTSIFNSKQASGTTRKRSNHAARLRLSRLGRPISVQGSPATRRKQQCGVEPAVAPLRQVSLAGCNVSIRRPVHRTSHFNIDEWVSAAYRMTSTSYLHSVQLGSYNHTQSAQSSRANSAAFSIKI